jgi:phytoene desaturase
MGYRVTVLEKNDRPGGRARQFSCEGFHFDMGPSWYWMPDVFDRFFERFGHRTSDMYELHRLDPSYQVVFGEGDFFKVPARMEALEQAFEEREPGAGARLREFLRQAAYKYEVGVNDLVYRPSLSLTEFIDVRLVKGLVQLDLLQSFRSHIRKFFQHPHLLKLAEFPVLFLGAVPQNTPALYSLMNYADMGLGTWYPMGGMVRIVEAMTQIALELGVEFRFNCEVEGFDFEQKRIHAVRCRDEQLPVDSVVGAADYHHIEQHLLPPNKRVYSPQYWEKRVMAPSSLLFYLGLNRKLVNLEHHNLFFDEALDQHADEIYKDPRWPSRPLFYACVPSKTDPGVAPEGCENVFLLMPTAPGLEDNEATRERYFDLMIERLERLTGNPDLRSAIVYKRSYAHRDFEQDYHAFKGNAYGLANTLRQTAILKPRMKTRKVKNLVFSGQLTVPGPGVPPSLISGEVAAGQVAKSFRS